MRLDQVGWMKIGYWVNGYWEELEALWMSWISWLKRKMVLAYMLGHSFFVPVEKVGDTAEQILWMQNVKLENEIKPLLAEYWYDDEKCKV